MLISQRNRLGDGPLFRAVVEAPKPVKPTREEWIAQTTAYLMASWLSSYNATVSQLPVSKCKEKAEEAARLLGIR